MFVVYIYIVKGSKDFGMRVQRIKDFGSNTRTQKGRRLPPVEITLRLKDLNFLLEEN